MGGLRLLMMSELKLFEDIPEDYLIKPDLKNCNITENYGKNVYLSVNNEDFIIDTTSKDQTSTSNKEYYTTNIYQEEMRSESLIGKLISKNKYNNLSYYSK